MPVTKYHYIIAGAGCAGLSLLVRILQNPFFGNKQVLVIDIETQKSNDRTWCFWEKQPGLFEPVVCKSWPQLQFYSKYFSSPVNIAPYTYKMIRGADFYRYAHAHATKNPCVHFLYGKIEATGNEGNLGFATVDGVKYYADYVFNSILPVSLQQSFSGQSSPLPGVTTLLQHFKGWVIETGEDVFDTATATFMDFRVEQPQEGAAFVYVLALAAKKALVEYTVISGKVLPPTAYDAGLESYIGSCITKRPFTIVEEEFGVIPMTDHPFSPGSGKVVNIGSAGGQTKASSGFTFNFIQKHTQAIVERLVQNKHPLAAQPFFNKRFRLYDSILLGIINTGKMPGDIIFARMFKNIPPETILRFLDSESSFLEELRIMAAMPAAIFLPAALKKMAGWVSMKYKL